MTSVEMKPYIFKVIITLGTALVLLGIVFISRIWWGPNNTVETTVEGTMNDMIEYELHLPEGSVKLDLSDIKSYPDVT